MEVTLRHIDDKKVKIKMLENYLKYPGETSFVDYKAARPFKEGDNFAHKLVKHILGMANSDGGYIVIGFKENKNKNLFLDPDLDENISKTYEITKLSQFINSFVDGDEKLEIEIHKINYKKKQVPIIEVKGFKKSPFFCKKTSSDGVLQEGILYIRDPAAKTVKIASSSDWERLIDICVKKRQDYLLEQVRIIFKELGMIKKSEKDVEEVSIKENFQKWINKQREEFKKSIPQIYNEKDIGFWEVTHLLLDREEFEFNQKILLDVTEKAQLNTDWPIGIVSRLENFKPKPDNEGIKTKISMSDFMGTLYGFEYWYFSKSGDYYFARTFVEDFIKEKNRKELWFERVISNISEAIFHCIKLYTKLKIPVDKQLFIQISWFGIKDRILTTVPNSSRILMDKKCYENSISWNKKVSLGELSLKKKDFIIEAVNKLFMMFDFLEIAYETVKDIIEDIERRY